MIFDGLCNFCNAGVDFVMRNDPREEILFAPSQSPAGQALLRRFGRPLEGVGTMLLVEGDRVSDRSTAVLRLARRLRFPWKLAYAFIVIPRGLRDGVYGWMGRNRYRFGRRESCRIPTERERQRFLDGGVPE